MKILEMMDEAEVTAAQIRDEVKRTFLRVAPEVNA